MPVLLTILVVGILTLLAAHNLVLVSHIGWTPRQRRAAWVALLLLLCAECAALLPSANARLLTRFATQLLKMGLAAAIFSFVAALFSAARFRWFTAIAAALMASAVFPLLLFLSSPNEPIH